MHFLLYLIKISDITDIQETLNKISRKLKLN